MFPKLETKRLVLREILPSDAEDIYSIFSNEEVTKYYGLNTFKKIEQAEKLIEAFTNNFQTEKGMRWGIEKKGFPGLIGTIGFNSWSKAHRRAEVGYEIYPDFWRNGYASEAVAKIVEYGFQEMGLTRIGAIVFVENDGSSQLLMKQGFEKEGILRKYMYQNNEAFDVIMLSKCNRQNNGDE
ncbi:ribosomal-protein-alanine N-acetyltransferase [Solibacillus kalamii]|uniref:GNAT family N-acetyltransferase n=1 Tax=Solibacillus kalamii TaxID=1748298 RepID=A0ABX3ZGG5_9BACL|nr:GNAT family N-acetyltransferase [Solibacillus kalamii]MBM7665758.1 ribosomal-protein-alanine N-acetyltransferase [Solibacillus kalamii]OUZ38794.1 GNAT family N-acetyltransferase [Solibacillus kalamii]